MIKSTFIFLKGVSKKTEENIIKQGIKNWDDFLRTGKIRGISEKRKKYYDSKIIEAKKALAGNDAGYFLDKLPQSENWRLYRFFREEAVFLDIETSGVNIQDNILLVGLFDGVQTKSMIYPLNLKALKEELSKYKMIVTFNGSSFDLPFIRKRFKEIIPNNIVHLDLKTVCHRNGLKGGLKEIERMLGIKRKNKIVEEMCGGDAFCLWRMYRATGDEYYLNLLIEYNEEDVINLKTIADKLIY